MTIVQIDHARDLRALRDRIEELEEENRQLRVDLMGERLQAAPEWLRLTPQEGRFVQFLRRHAGRTLPYGLIHRHICDQDTGDRLIHVVACKARAKLRRAGISITTIWGIGFRLEADEALKLEALTREGAA